MSVNKTIEDLKSIVQDLDNKGIAVTPLSEAISSLESQVSNITKVESSIEAIRNEIIAPVKSEISTGHKLSRLGYYVGVVGIGLAILSVSYSFITANRSDARLEEIEKSITSIFPEQRDQNQSSFGAIQSESFVSTQDNSREFNEIVSLLRRLEVALVPAKQFEAEPGSYTLLPFETLSIETEGGTILNLEYSDTDFEIYQGNMCGLLSVSINGIRVGNSGFSIGEQFTLHSETVEKGTLSDRFSREFERTQGDRVRLCEGEVFSIFDTTFSIVSIDSETPLGRASGDQASQMLLKVQ